MPTDSEDDEQSAEEYARYIQEMYIHEMEMQEMFAEENE